MSIHGLLERVILPAENVIGMVREPGGVATRPDERLVAVGEVGRVDVVERSRIPDRLEQNLRQTNGVRGGARAAGLEGAALGVGDVVLVVGGVEVLAVPAGREAVVGHDAVGARLGREVDRFGGACGCVLHACVGELAELTRLIAIAVGRIADEHAEAGLERRYCRLLGCVE